jgi:hypothetical protein
VIWLQRFLIALGALACMALAIFGADKAMAGIAHE